MKTTNEQQVLQQVINEAWENEGFKVELMAEPLKAIEKLTGKKVELPKGKTLVVRDQTDAATIYINIPAEICMDDVELNEEQLEVVAGGKPLDALRDAVWNPMWNVKQLRVIESSNDPNLLKHIS